MTPDERILLMQADDLLGLSMELLDLIYQYREDKQLTETLRKVNYRVMADAKTMLDGLCGDRSDYVKGFIREADLLKEITEEKS